MPFCFEDFTLDAERRELRRGTQLIALEPQVFDLLVYVIQNRDRVVSRDDLIASVWGGRIVSESTLSSRINAARQALGDSGDAQRLIKTIQRKGIRFTGEAREEPPAAPMTGGEPVAAPFASAVRPAQNVSFCKASDGVNLAVASSGSGLPVVKAATWLTHIEYDWRSPVWSPLFTLLSEKFRLIRYDERGNGLSDRDVADISFEAFVRDLEAVVDALGLETFALLGISQGAAVSIAYAARHPERVSRLVLYNGYALGWRRRESGVELEKREAIQTLVRLGWGQDNPAFRQIFTSQFIPGGTAEQVQWFNDLQRVSASPENAIRLGQAFGEIDISALLSKVTVPTLVLHARGDARIPFEQGLMLAREIPGAQFIALESDNHIMLSHEPAWPRFADEVCAFLQQKN